MNDHHFPMMMNSFATISGLTASRLTFPQMLKRTPKKRVPFGDVESDINATAQDASIMKSGGKGKRLLCSPGKNNYPSAKNPDLLLDTKDGAEWDDVSNEINACSPKDLSSIELSVSEPRNTRSSRKTPSKKATEKEEQENAPEIQASLQQSKTPSRTRATVAAAPAPVSTASSKNDSPVLTSPGPVTRSRSRRSITKPIELKAEEEKKAEESKEEEVKAEEELPAVMSDEHKVEAASAPAMEVAERKMPVVMMGMLFFLALSAAIFFFLQSSPSSRVEL